MRSVSLPTPDGPCTTWTFRPDRPGTFPAVIFVIDGFGPRPALFAMAQRIADAGYVVALPDLYHRAGDVTDLLPPGTVLGAGGIGAIILADPTLRVRWRERFYSSATAPAHVTADIGAVLDHLAGQLDVQSGPVGIVGYCMGGGIALRAGSLFGERFGAVASFHGGMLATDAPDSPHLGASSLRATVLIAGAIEDPSFPPEMATRLGAALTDAGVRHTLEIWPARHGFCVSDAAAYDAACADRHYTALADLFAAAPVGASAGDTKPR